MPEFDEPERAAILAEYDRLAKQRLPWNLTGCGCLVFILGGMMFCALPVLLADRSVEDGGKIFMTLVVIVLIVVGLWLMVRGNQKGRAGLVQVNAALEALRQSSALAPEDRRAAAIRLVRYVPKRDWDWRAEKWRGEIPEALPYVLAVREVVTSRPGRTVWGRGRGATGSGPGRS